MPRGYNLLPNATLLELLRLLSTLDLEGDAFGKVYEYFLGNFALKEGQKGGVFYTPTSIVRLIVEILQPFHGRIFDPACGSGGMFVQSADFVRRHQRNATSELSVFGTEKASDTVMLAEMAAQGWSLNPGRYVGVGARAADEFDFSERLEELNRERVSLNSDAASLEAGIEANLENLENGKTGFVQFLSTDEATAFGSTEFIALRSKTLTPEFVYWPARSDRFRDNAIKSMSGASGRQRV